MHERILIIDCGSQVTRLIGRRLRELHVYCEIHAPGAVPPPDPSVKGVILSGSPHSVHDPDAPDIGLDAFRGRVPILGICYGAQLIAARCGGTVQPSDRREYGRALLQVAGGSDLFAGIPVRTDVWMSHGDTVTRLPDGALRLASTVNPDGGPGIPNAAFQLPGEPTYGVQFHPEVHHTAEGRTLLRNFAYRICGCRGDWTPASYIDGAIADIRARVGDERVILGLSGGVDSTVAAVLLHRAIGDRITCLFIDNGLLRLGEYDSVLASYRGMGLPVIGIDASATFLTALRGITDPEAKRKAIGKAFIDTFEENVPRAGGASWLAQGTIYPDVIESAGQTGSAKIKSHHNVGGLPDQMKLKVIEPLRPLFKDEVRRIGRALGIDEALIGRHPFPGPSLAIRILGEVTPERLDILRRADDIFIRALRAYDCRALGLPLASDPERQAGNLYEAVWQAGVILLPVRSVGVMGDGRTYESAVALRAVVSTDAMTADWAPLPHDFLAAVSNDIINRVPGINRVVYDISSKPPATIEWE